MKDKYLIWLCPLLLWVSITTAEPILNSPWYLLQPNGNCGVLLSPVRPRRLERQSQKHVTEEEKQLNLQSYPSPLQLEETQSRSLMWPQQFISSLSMHKKKLENH